jgi:hypothetical protein
MNRDDDTGLQDDTTFDADQDDTGLNDQDEETRRDMEEGFYDETR